MISLEELKEFLRKKIEKPETRILLQIPGGLKTEATKIVEEIQKLGHEVILSAEPCFGACDIRDEEAKQFGCDFIIHLGHNKFYKPFKVKVPVIYFPIRLNVSYNKNELKKIPYKKIGIVSVVQHLDILKNISEELRKINKKPVIGGQILGCWHENAKKIENKVDCFLFIGSGEFHPLGIKTEKSVYCFDLEKNEIRIVNKMKRLKILHANLAKLDDAKTVGILVSTKKGQFLGFDTIKKLKNKLEKMGKKVYILTMDNITNEKLLGLKIDFFIDTACPRLVEDNFDKPIINAEDLFDNTTN